jgi:hypothetical protein
MGRRQRGRANHRLLETRRPPPGRRRARHTQEAPRRPSSLPPKRLRATGPGVRPYLGENAAKLSGLTVKAIRDAAHEGKLDVTTIRNKPHVRLADLDALRPRRGNHVLDDGDEIPF